MLDEVLTPAGSWRALDQFAEDDRVTFYAEPDREELQNTFRQLTTEKRFARRRWPDADLPAFARVGGLNTGAFRPGGKHQLEKKGNSCAVFDVALCPLFLNGNELATPPEDRGDRGEGPLAQTRRPAYDSNCCFCSFPPVVFLWSTLRRGRGAAW